MARVVELMGGKCREHGVREMGWHPFGSKVEIGTKIKYLAIAGSRARKPGRWVGVRALLRLPLVSICTGRQAD